MKKIFKNKIKKAKESFGMSAHSVHSESGFKMKGEVFIKIVEEDTGEVLHDLHIDNLIVADAGILIARLCKDNSEPNFGINMLAVGTGATGSILSPDAPDVKQRRLNNEIERKTFSSTTFRDDGGVAVAYPTNIVDFTTVFTASEAVGPLNEMALMSTVSSDPLVQNLNPNTFPTYDDTVDTTLYDTIVNYITFGVITKTNTAQMTITWRLTF